MPTQSGRDSFILRIQKFKDEVSKDIGGKTFLGKEQYDDLINICKALEEISRLITDDKLQNILNQHIGDFIAQRHNCVENAILANDIKSVSDFLVETARKIEGMDRRR
ncbi:hypothetical protein Cyrtocomes_01217 [Candidatus Cyrtobacter comes]|uniref:Uncharacterized protein n=1 Tax=Candidatus Cyrtobacter comes TaxID=675776 RepID=A0ABU5L9K7_9RICK|nr:hypothetical protein [Candidatus Cyrtobacter comes]MDZ5762822.1 hypothetical protein [Candidatus Cyrtobacter comes]